MGFGSTKPVHNYFQSVGSGSTHNSFTAFFNDAYKAFYNYENVGTGSTHNTFAVYGYEMIPLSPFLTIGFDEGIELSDEVLVFMHLTVEEGILLGDTADVQMPVEISEGIELDTETSFVMIALIDEGQPLTDEVLAALGMEIEGGGIELGDAAEPCSTEEIFESQVLGEECLVQATMFFDAGQPLGDSVFPNVQVDCVELVHMQDEVYFRADFDNEHSIAISIIGEVNTESSFEVNILQFNPVPANVLSHPNNPWAPILQLDGITYAGSPVNSSNIIHVDRNAGLGSGSCSAGVLAWSANFNFLGGTFEIQSLGSLGNIGAPLNVCGYQGIITEQGPGVTDKNIFVTRGIFGTREFNRQLLLAGQAADPALSRLMQGVYLQSPPISQWSTISTAVQNIAAKAGIGLKWFAQNGVLTDIFAESGMTIGEALQSLASRVGAIVVWTGTPNSFVVMSPDFGVGGWSGFPNCKLITSIITTQILDENREYVILPVRTTAGANIYELPPNTQAPKPEIVEPLFHTRTKIEQGDPVTHIQLPPDFHGQKDINGRIQILVNPEDVGPTFTTDDHNKFFAAGLPVVQESGTGVYKLQLTNLPFPNQLENNKFGMTIGYVRKTDLLEEASLQSFSERLEKQKILINSDLDKLRYIKTDACQVSGYFFGSSPLPGQTVSFQKGAANFVGICESVSISGSANSLATISISAGKYKRIEFFTARQFVDRFWATGAGGQVDPGG